MYTDKKKYNIVSIDKDTGGEIKAYELDNGEIVDKPKAVEMARQGLINGVTVSVSKYGEEYLKGMPDGDKSNNLDNLTEI